MLKKLLFSLAGFVMAAYAPSSLAQFKITQTFQQSSAAGWTFANSAYLTAPTIDPVGSGWLRLTDIALNEKGTALYTASSFTSGQGLVVEFNYVSWGGTGADGITLFLYDATQNMSGATTGGGLGYCGGAGGYLAIALDEYGNFSNPADKCGAASGGPGAQAEKLVIRGPLSANNAFVTNTSVPGGIDHPGVATRPIANTVLVTLTPAAPGFNITAQFASGGGAFTTLASGVNFPYAPPAALSVGLSGGTGGSTNAHEVSLLTVSVPDDVQAGMTGPAFTTQGGTITYNVTVTNNGPNAVNNANSPTLVDTFPAALTGVTWTCAGTGGATCPASGSGNINTAGMTLPVGAAVTYTVTGTVAPATACGTTLTNSANVDFGVSAGFTDSNPNNNKASLSTLVVCIAPQPDTGTSVFGTASTPIANVVANDAVNGAPATLGGGGNATIIAVGSYPAGLSLSTITGAVKTTAALAAGTYTVQYQLCDKKTPAHCANSTITVNVVPLIDAVADSGTASAGTASTPVANVTSNDLINAQPVTLGGGGNGTITPVGVFPAGITLSTTTGAVTVANTVAPGTYTPQYKLCDKNATPNCATATITITVNAVIVAAPDSGTASAGTASTPVANVAANDFVNGVAANLASNATIAVVGVYPAGIVLNTGTGAVTVANTAAPGTYTVQYQLCDRNTPVNCATGNVTITVNAVIVAAPDSGTAAAGTASTPVANVAANDFVNGFAANLASNATIATVGSYPAGIALNTGTGAVTVANTVAPGTYTVQYQLCDRNTPVNCATGTVTITVNAVIVAAPDSGTAAAGTASTPVASVTANDTVNGVAANLASNATIATVGSYPAGIALNTGTGAVTVANTVAPGTYTVQYQLCDRNTPVNCATGNVTITVNAVIVAAPDSGTAAAGTASTPVANVTANDTVNGVAANLASNATIATVGSYPAGIALNTGTGAVTVANTVAPGTYTVQYQLCDRNTPVNCATGNVTITVNAVIVAAPDSGTAAAGTASTPVANVTANDTVNGVAANLASNATIATVGSYPAGIALNTGTGAVTVANTVAPGTYTVQYQLCDRNTPVNCATGNVTITVNAVIVAASDSGTAAAGTASTPVANVAANDTVNGVAANLASNATISVVGSYPAGIALNTGTGAVTVANTVAPGTYTVQYQLCDRNTPVNCAPGNVTITINAVIVAAPDSGTAAAGTASTPVANVAANDTVNGVAANLASNATIATVGSYPAGIALNTGTGAVTVANTVAPGTYTVQYQLCDRNTPVNCAAGTVTITVNAVIVAASDSGTAAAGTASTPVANVAANDTVNGVAANLASNATISVVGSYPAGIALNTGTGAVTVANTVAPGTYTVQYQLCDRNTPVNCAAGTVTITVNAVIVAASDSGTAAAGTASTPVANVTANDTVNGVAANLASNATIATVGSYPAGIALNTGTGAVTVANTVAPGTYTVQYQLCDRNTPVNCATGNVTITVNAVIVAAPDSGTAAAGTASTPVANVAANDTVNGVAANLASNATIATVGSYPAGIALNTGTGAVTVANTVAPGTYTVQYQLCDRNTPVNCATGNVTITVNAVIVAAPDSGTAAAGTASTPVANVTANDTVNGVAANLASNATISVVGIYPAGIALNTGTGAVTVANTVAPGTYTVQYQLCDRNTPVNCATGNVTITVNAVIVAAPDSGTAAAGTASTPVANVTANDTVNGVAANLASNATISVVGIYPAGIALNTGTGAVTVTGAVAPGTYTVQYQLCDRNTPVNCATGNVTITVNAVIVAAPDSGTAAAGTASTPVANVTANDTVNGVAANLASNATIATVGSYPAGIALNTGTGAVTVANTVAPGTYTVQYQLCDRNTPVNCAAGTVTITINAVIVAASDSGTAAAGTASTPVANVTANDTVNGVAANLASNATIATVGSYPAGIALNTGTGAVTVANTVAPGTYTVQYQLCDRNTPVNCATGNVTITVNAVIVAAPDSGTAAAGTASTPVANVTANDTVNGVAANLASNATIATVGSYPAGIALNTGTGAVMVANTVAPGTYTVQYQLCDKLAPPHCSTGNVTITVNAVIIAASDSGTAAAGTASTPVANVTANDTVNGVAANLASNATIATVGSYPAGIALNAGTGAVTVANTVAPGTYTVQYQLCDRNTPVNCAAGTVTITVNAVIVAAPDSGTAAAGTASTPVANVAANDTVNGVAANLASNATIATVGSYPAGIALNTGTGAVTVANTVAPGTYTVQYQLCDRNTPVNCATGNVTITVNAVIVAAPDSGTAAAGTASTPVANVAANDTVNGVAANLASNATIATVGSYPAGIALNTGTGAVTVANTVSPGPYTVQYQLCDKLAPPHCASGNVTITINAVIVAAPDSGTAAAGTASTPVANVTANDTVNGVAANLASNATIATVGSYPAGIALNTGTGAVTVANTVAPGTYTVQYQLCDRNTPVNCAAGTVTITVNAVIVAASDSGTAAAGTASTPVANVTANDTVNGVAANLASNATIATVGSYPAGIALNTGTGAVTVANTVAPGSYTVQYQLCDRNTPANCATGTVTITVNAVIVAAPDSGTAAAGTASTPVANVTANDTVNGVAANLASNATIATVGSYPAGFGLNTGTGAVTVANTVVPGPYTVQYQLCDRNTPVNCAAGTVTITVNAVIFAASDSGTAAAGTASTPVANVTANDTVNGVAANLASNATISVVGIYPAGIALNTGTGAVTVTGAVAPGTYTVQYQLCDRNTPVNCASGTVIITVNGAIVAAPDSGTAAAGTASTPVANVTANDTVNGVAANLASNATISVVGIYPAGIALNTGTGAVTVTGAVAPGTYTVQYQLCDKLAPPHCATGNVTITVNAVIVAAPDSGTAAAGTASTPVASVTANDTVNGVAANLASNATIATVGSYPAGIALNTGTGAVTVTGAVAPGTYTVQYQLCDRNTPVNCATGNVTITVNAVIVAAPDSGTAAAGTASTPVANVTANDTVNGVAANLASNATISVVGIYPAGIALNTGTGAVTVTGAVAPGTYTVQYQLCDRNTPANCATGTVTITVNAVIVAAPDSGTAAAGTASTPVANVAANDTVNGVAANLASNATISVVGIYPAGIALNTGTGAVTVANTVAPGTYTVQYQLCDKLAPPHCATGTVTITVNAVIVAAPDSGTAAAGTASTPVANVAANDTVNGVAANLASNATISVVGIYPAGITLNTGTGAVTVANTVPPGTYTVQYQLCDRSTPANCATGTVTITVNAVIVAAPDSGTASAGTASTPVANVTANDTVNGVAANLASNATIATVGSYPAGITLNTGTGAVTVANTVAPGTYTVQYQLCDRNTSVNCATGNVTITVNAVIIAASDSGTAAAGTASTPVANVTANDTVNGVAANLATNATIATVGSYPAGIALNTGTGAVTVANTVAPGTYTVQYQLCDRNTPVNCAIGNVTITVNAVIVAAPDSGTAAAGTASTPVANVTANDTVNGVAANLASNATISVVGIYPAGIALNTGTGAVTVTGAVVPGTYTVQYQLCDKLAPPHCATGTVTITVNAVIVAAPDSGTAAAGTASTPVANVVANDTVNGVAANLASNATISVVGIYPAGIALNTGTGAVTVTGAVAPGTYTVQYQLCDKLAPPHCATGNVTITVNAVIVAAPDSGTASAGTASTPVANVTANDSVNGVAANLASNATISVVGIYPAGIALNTGTGAVTVANTVAPGTYTVQYQLCDKLAPPHCATGNVTITVNAVIIAASDSGTAAAGTASTPVANVTANDSVNGVAANLASNATISVVGIYPAGIALNTGTGAATVANTVAPGTYTVQYQLCDRNTPVNCATGNVTITVNAVIVAASDSGTAAAGTASTPVANVAANDTVNGVAANLASNATISVVGIYPAGIALNTGTGAVTVANTVAPGTYTVQYKLCDKSATPNCATTTITITVNAVIVAAPDSGTAAAGTASTPVANVTANDTVNGVAANLASNATIATVGSYPAGIALNTGTGAVTLANTVTPGTYTVQYQLCDKLAPPHCATGNVTITVNAVIIAASDSGTAAAGTASTPVANVTANDAVNGVAANLASNATIATVGSYPAGIALNTGTGAVTVANTVAPGTYTVQYQLCDKLAPPHCATGNVTITVNAVIVAAPDSGTAAAGTASTPVANVTANDTVNGAAANLASNATIATVGSYPAGIALSTGTGAVTVANTVAPGTYTVQYQLCDKLAPPHCASGNVTITVNAVIVAAPDSGAAAAGTASTPVANVAANDTVNGVAANLASNATISVVGSYPAGIALNTGTGAVTVANTVTPGTYTVQYQLCDRNTPVNCATGNVTITVNAVIVAAPDSGTAAAGTASTPVANVAANDFVNGFAANLASNATIATVGSYPAGIALNTGTGAVTVANTVTPGTYTVQYQLCDKLAPPHCATGNVTINVNAVIVAAPDSGTAAAGTASTPVANVTANDTVNGVAANLASNATIATVGSYPPGIALNTGTGAVTVASTVAPGTYTVQYQLCDRNTPVNCATGNVTITVNAVIVAAPDSGAAAAGTASTPVANVAANDTVNGVAANLASNATISVVGIYPAGIALNTGTGAVTVANTVAPGTYTVQYQLCDRNTSVNCATGNVTITVNAVIVAAPDSGTAAAGTVSTPVANVTANDAVNGVAANLASNATIATVGSYPAGIALNTGTGAVTVANTVAPGTYTVQYQLCDKLAPPHCATGNVTITVNAVIVAAPDSGTAAAGTASTPVANVTANDTVNGAAANLASNATIATVGSYPAGIALSTGTGAVTVANTVAPGTYTVQYQLCDKLAPPHCASGNVTITVNAVIVAAPDSGAAAAGTASTPVANVTANDTVNGVAANLASNATISVVGIYPAGIALNTGTGAVTVTGAVAPGTYTVQYQLCDKLAPPHCATGNVTITVNAVIVAAPDSGTAAAGTASTPVANVTANDTVNGAAANLASNATIATVGSYPAGIALSTGTGAVTVANTVAPGTYTVQYQLCDKLAPPHCATATITLTITATIAPQPDSGTMTAGTAGTAVANVAGNDTVNGQPATLGAAGNATISAVGTYPPGIALNTGTGAVTTTAALVPGTYTVQYRLCDRSVPTPNCATGTVTVTVSAAIVAQPDAGTTVAGAASTAVANVAANDTINGQPATLGAAGNATIAAFGTYPAGIALDPTTGAVTTTATVAAGSYSIQYQLCDRSTPPHCSTGTVTLNVLAPALVSTAKAAGVPTQTTATAFEVPYVVVVGTAGPATAISFNVQANDSLALAFPGATAVGVKAGTLQAAGAGGAICTVNAAFNGSADTRLLAGTDTLAGGQSCVVSFIATVAYANIASIPRTPQANSAYGSAIPVGSGPNRGFTFAGGSPLAPPNALGIAVSVNGAAAANNAPPGTPPPVPSLPPAGNTVGSPTMTTLTVTAASISGSVWNDAVGASAGNQQRTADKPGLAGWTVVLINPSTGQIATLMNGSPATATTGANGDYQIAGAAPGTYRLQFVAPGSNVVWGTPVNGETNDPQPNSTLDPSLHALTVVLLPSATVVQQSLPVDPSGVVYDSRTRTPLAGAAVTLLGPNGTAVPAADLLPGQQGQTTAADGAYRFDVQPAAANGVYTIQVAAPSGYTFPSIALPPQAGALPLQPGPRPYAVAAGIPAPGQPAHYYLQLNFAPATASAAVIQNDIPLDSTRGGALLIEKIADRTQAEVGDSVRYRIRVQNTGSGVVAGTTVADALPLGFKLIPGTVLVGRDGALPLKFADPMGTPGPRLSFSIGNVGPGESVEIDYRVRIAVGADRGNGTNSAQAQGIGGVASQVATAHVLVTGGAFTTNACVLGKVYVDCNGNRVQDPGEPGIPGVRLYFEDGTNITTDENGNYSICGMRPITHALKVDAASMPFGSRLVPLSSRNAGDGDSLFVDLRDGELHRADFAEGSCTDKVMEQVRLRRAHGPIFAPVPPAGPDHIGVDFDSDKNPLPQASGHDRTAGSTDECRGGQP